MNRTPKTDITVRLVGTDGNAFAVIATVSRALRRGGHADVAKEWTEAAMQSGSYDELLQLVFSYVEVE